MSTTTERNWTAHLVVSCEHAGLRPHFKALEAELYHALARIDDPRGVQAYLRAMCQKSREWSALREFRANLRGLANRR